MIYKAEETGAAAGVQPINREKWEYLTDEQREAIEDLINRYAEINLLRESEGKII